MKTRKRSVSSSKTTSERTPPEVQPGRGRSLGEKSPGLPTPRLATPTVFSSKPFWNLWTDGVTQGLLETFLTCPEKLRLRMIEGQSPLRGSGALAFGSLVHEVLDQVYTAIGKGERKLLPVISKNLEKCEAKDKARAQERPPTDPRFYEEMEENYGFAEAIIPAYYQHWKTDLEGYEWISLEKKFSVPYFVAARLGIARPFIPVRGKRDGDFRQGKELWLFETKTKARIDDEAIVEKLPYDLQVMLYLWSMKQDYGEYPKGVVYNLIRRPQLRKRQTESLQDFCKRVQDDIAARPEFYFVRYLVSIREEELDLWELQFDMMMRQLINWWEGGFHYKVSSACNGRMGVCDLLPICSRNDTSSHYQREEVFPELVQIGAD